MGDRIGGRPSFALLFQFRVVDIAHVLHRPWKPIGVLVSLSFVAPALAGPAAASAATRTFLARRSEFGMPVGITACQRLRADPAEQQQQDNQDREQVVQHRSILPDPRSP